MVTCLFIDKERNKKLNKRKGKSNQEKDKIKYKSSGIL